MKQIRAAIKAVAPKAKEKISYGMPYYDYHGRLIYFAAYKNHIGVYLMGGSRTVLPKSLTAYRTSKATLRLPLENKVPVSAIKTLVKAQMRTNERQDKRAR